jgi:hypothetical protein
MLRVVPRRWLSRDFAVLENERSIAAVRFERSSGAAKFTIGDAAYTIRQEQPGYGVWALETEGGAIAGARSVRTLFRHSCVVEYAGKRYQLEDRSVFRRNLVVREGVQYVGYIESERALTNELSACLPEYLPLVVRVFIVSLVMDPWADQDEIM